MIRRADDGPSTSRRRAARGSTAFAIAAFLQRGIGFVMLPIYTRAVVPAEFGQLAVVLTVAAAVGTILSFGLETAVFRTWFQLRADERDRDRFVNTIGLFILTVPIATALVASVTVVPALADSFSVPPLAMALGILGVAVRTTAMTLPMVLLRAQERIYAYLILTAVSVAGDTLLMVVLVVVLDAGVQGWLLASLLSSTLLLLVGLAVQGHRWTSAFDSRHLGSALAFGLPLLPHAVSHWALSLSDRAVLGAYVAASEIGIYNLAYQLSIPISVLTIALHQGVMPLYAQASVDEAHRHALSRVVTNQVLVTLFLGLGAAVLGPPFVLLAMPKEYADAVEVLPWIALGLTLFGLYLIPMDAMSLMAGRTRWVWVATALAALANVGLNLALVPRYGVMAAAVNTAVGYAVLLAAIYVLMWRTMTSRISYEWARIALALAVVMLAAGFAMMAAPLNMNGAVSFGLRATLVVVAMLLLWRIATWDRPPALEGQSS